MTKAFPPRRPRGGPWIAPLAAAVLLASPSAGLAQEDASKKAEAAPKADDAKKADPQAKSDEKGVAKPPVPPPDRYDDPRNAEALQNNFPELPAGTIAQDDKQKIDQFAAGQGTPDRSVISRFVRNRTAALTNRANIKALADPAARAGNPKALETAAADLMKPLMVDPTSANERFRQEYTAALIDAFKTIWEGNLHSRLMAMIVLSQSGDVQALPVFAEQLADSDQLAIVKLRAAVGISTVARNGRRTIAEGTAIPAAKALAEFLTREKDTFWPAQFRALEALGSLRVATERPSAGRAEFLDAAAAFAADPAAAPDVRAWASWALGMIRVPESIKGYNPALAANLAGGAAADIGARIAAMPDASPSRIKRLANLLVQIELGFLGEPEVRDSGLSRSTHPDAAAARPHVAEVEKRVRAVTKAALDLGEAIPAQLTARRQALATAVDDLRAFVAKPLPSGRSLYKGGPEIAPAAPREVATGARP